MIACTELNCVMAFCYGFICFSATANEEDVDEGLRTGKDHEGKRINNPKRERSRRSAPSVVPLSAFTLKSELRETENAGVRVTILLVPVFLLHVGDNACNILLTFPEIPKGCCKLCQNNNK